MANKRESLKLFVWCDPYDVAYGSSMVIAVAPNVKEARLIAYKSQAYSYNDLEKERPNVALGKPSRVVDVPCAEWHEWSE